jgi:hypothetical protein
MPRICLFLASNSSSGRVRRPALKRGGRGHFPRPYLLSLLDPSLTAEMTSALGRHLHVSLAPTGSPRGEVA